MNAYYARFEFKLWWTTNEFAFGSCRSRVSLGFILFLILFLREKYDFKVRYECNLAFLLAAVPLDFVYLCAAARNVFGNILHDRTHSKQFQFNRKKGKKTTKIYYKLFLTTAQSVGIGFVFCWSARSSLQAHTSRFFLTVLFIVWVHLSWSF